MRLLLWHCRQLNFKDVKPSTRPSNVHMSTPKASVGTFSNVVLCFACIEAEDVYETAAGASKAVADFASISSPKNGIVLMPFAHLSSHLAPPDKARTLLKTMADLLTESSADQIALVSFGFHKDLLLRSMDAFGHPGSVAFREIPPPSAVHWEKECLLPRSKSRSDHAA